MPVAKKEAAVPKGETRDTGGNAASVPTHYYGEDFLTREVQPGSNTIDLELSATPSESNS